MTLETPLKCEIAELVCPTVQSRGSRALVRGSWWSVRLVWCHILFYFRKKYASGAWGVNLSDKTKILHIISLNLSYPNNILYFNKQLMNLFTYFKCFPLVLVVEIFICLTSTCDLEKSQHTPSAMWLLHMQTLRCWWDDVLCSPKFYLKPNCILCECPSVAQLFVKVAKD